jgi:hypothetical protein
VGLIDIDIPETPKRKGRRKEVAGPYRDQSSVKSIRKEATKREHRKIPPAPRKSKGTTHASGIPARRKAKRIKDRSLDKALDILNDAPRTPTQVVSEAKRGVKPPDSKQWRAAFPKAAKKADENFIRNVASKEGVKADPLAEFVISTAATGGVGAAAKGVGALAKSALAARAGSELASAGATVAGKAVEAGAKGIAARTASKVGTSARAGAKRLRTAPERTVRRVRETPKRIKSAPKRAQRAATTKDGRRAARKGAARKARRHPVRTGYGSAAVSPVPLPGDADQRARAFAKGTYDAFTKHPGEVAETTAHGAIGFLTAPLGIAAASVDSAKKGSAAPLGKELKAFGEGTADMISKLASGDPKTVEETTRKETGAVPFIPVPHLIRRAKGTRLYEDTVRGKIRGKVEGKRAKTRARRMDDAKAKAESGEYVSRKKAKKIKHPVKDTARTNEYYVNRAIGRFIEKQRSRHYISREDARMRSGPLAGRMATESVAKKLRKSKGTNQSEINHGEALRILGKHGIPVNERGYAYVKRVAEGYAPWKYGDTPQGAVLDRHAAKYLLDHPEAFKDKHVAAGLETLNKRSAEIGGHSPRNQFQAQLDNIINPILKEEGRTPILKPEEMVPDPAVSVLRTAVPKRTDPWNRSEALSYARDLAEVKGKSRAKALVIRKQIMDSMEGLMKPPEHGGAEGGVSTTRAVAWTPGMEAAMVKAARREGKRLGLTEPTPYLADKFPKGLGEAPSPTFKAEIPLNKIWPSRGIAAKSGNALADLESTLFHSLEVPLQRKATVKGFSRIMDNIARPVENKHLFTTREAERLTNMGKVPDGTLFVRRQALRALLEEADQVTPEAFSAAVAREIEIGQKLSTGEQIASAIKQADDMGLKGDKVVPVDAVAMHELMAQLNGPMGVSVGVGRATNFASRAILNSPAFELSQFAQEGLPMAAALSRDVANVPRAIAAVKHIKDFPPEIQAEIMAAVGSSSGLMGAPTLKALRSDSFLNPARIAAHPKAWQAFWRLANGTYLGRFDKARAGLMRETGAIAKIEGDFKRAEKGFQLWRSSAGNLFKDMDSAVKAMKGMTPEERAAFVASHPKLGDRLQKSMNGLAGNWNSFTAFEKNIAPFTIFYAFQRYSVLWTLYHFPMDHPVVATALALTGQVNAQELQRIAAEHGGASPTPLDYAKPVVGDRVLPSGSRFTTVLGAPQQAILEGKPTAALGSLPPPVSIPLEAAVGKNFYTEQPLGENGWLYMLRQGANLSPLSRFFGLPDLGKTQSPGSKVFEQQDPLRSKRSVLNPYIGQSADNFGEEKRIEKEFDAKYGLGDIPGPFDSKLVQDLLYGNDGKPKPEMLPKVLDEIHKAERASNYIKRKEAPFLPPSSDFTDVQKELLQAVEDAWQTGPNAEPEEGGSKYSGSNKYSSDNKYLGGNKYLSGNKYAE